MEKINWSKFDDYSEDTCYCKCGKVYRSHAKGVKIEGKFKMVTRKLCPGCGASVSNCRRYQSNPEIYTITEPKR